MRAAIILAAGASSRFGRQNKLLAPLGGHPLLWHALQRAAASGAARLLVVVPSLSSGAARAARSAAVPRSQPVVARAHRRGMGASFAAALRQVRPIERELLIFLGDMPLVPTGAGLRLEAGQDAARPAWNGLPGHPVLVRTAAARAAIRHGPAREGLLASLDRGRIALHRASPRSLRDVDTRRALAQLRYRSHQTFAHKQVRGVRPFQGRAACPRIAGAR